MANDGQIVFEVTADGKHAIADIKEITRAIQQESGKWDKSAKESTDNISANFSGMLKKLVAGFSAVKIGKALLDIGKDAIDAASDLQEVQNVVDVTFGDGAAKIEKWSKTAGAQFGLTETQAKKFSSTMGAMMKSSGLAGEQITDMSTDLAGLAADMASFYNLDFEEAFAKIRSGISGETEPLKQLGINMSVANLNAYALQQGLDKTFDQMSQGEQTMLRYQYMMSATADAQGDFARTSDGYANSMRTLETNIESLKTKLGEVLIPAVSDAVSWVNDLLTSLSPDESKKTVLDDFNAIDIDTEKKLQQIKETAQTARLLTEELDKIGGEKSSKAGSKVQQLVDDLSGINLDEGKTAALTSFVSTLSSNIEIISAIQGTDADGAKEWLTGIADAANDLSPDDAAGWESLVATIKEGLPGFENTDFGSSFFEALNKVEISDKAEAVKDFIGKLGDNVDKVAELRGEDAEDAAEWIKTIGEAADSLDPNDADGWAKLLDAIKEGLPGLENEEFGKTFFAALGEGFEQVGKKSSVMEWAINNLGDKTDKTAQEQAFWLETCKELVKTIPGLSSIINVETGEVKGGTEAVKDYIKAWEEGQTKLAMMGALEQKKSALSERFAELPGLQLDMALAQKRARDARKDLVEIWNAEFDEAGNIINNKASVLGTPGQRQGLTWQDWEKAKSAYEDLLDAEQKATTAYNEKSDALKEAEEAIKDYEKTVEEMPGTIEKTVDATEEWIKATGKTEDEIKKLVETANSALTDLANYAANVRESVAGAVDSVVSGFNKVTSPAQALEKQLSDLKAQMDEGIITEEEYRTQKEKLTQSMNDQGLTVKGMTDNLKSQVAFMSEYLKYLEEARAKGVSEDVLAELSDGSTESADRLKALAGASTDEIEQINGLYADVQRGKEQLTDALTQQKLTADAVYKSMADAAKEAVAALDLESEAKDNAGKTVSGMASGIAEHVSEVQSAVDSIITQLDRLNGWGIDISFGGFGSIHFTTSAGKEMSTHALMGWDYIPRDDFPMKLHEGEGVLTAEENRIWHGIKSGGFGTDELEALSGAVSAGVKPGGNVYLDGRIVGEVISAQQGKAYRQLTRSGWQGG